MSLVDRVPGKRLPDRKRYLSVLLVLVLAALACNVPSAANAPTEEVAGQAATNPPPAVPTRVLLTSTATDTPLPTETPTLTLTPTSTPVTPSQTPLPTITPTPSDTPTPGPTNTPLPPTPIIVNSENNRLKNPGFEGSVRPVIFGEVNVFEGWEPFYCDQPYTPQKCPAPRPCIGNQQGGCNPPDLKMRRPEYKATNLDSRVHDGETAQQWFCFFGTCQAGVFQVFPTTPGEACEVGAYIQSWSNYDDDLASELGSDDDRANSVWQIIVDRDGGTYAFSDDVLKSDRFGYSHGIYDKYVKISFTFVATADQTTVFFMDTRLWPIGNNDSYIDDAYAVCE